MNWTVEIGLVVLVFLVIHLAGEIAKLSKRLELITNRLAALQLVADGISKGQDNIWDKVFEIEARGHPEALHEI